MVIIIRFTPAAIKAICAGIAAIIAAVAAKKVIDAQEENKMIEAA